MRTRLKNHILGKQPSFREQLNLFFSNSFLFTMLVISIFFFWTVALANLTSHTEALLDSLLLDLDQDADGDLSDESPQVTAIELGHATDTTITRTGAGAIAVEGTAVLLSGGAAGQPSSIDLTNGTSLPLTGTTGTVANLMTALTDDGAYAPTVLGWADAAAAKSSLGYYTSGDTPSFASVIMSTSGLMANGSDFRVSTTTTAHEWSIQIYDNDDTTWRDAFNFANGNSPTVTAGAGTGFDFTGAGSVLFGPFAWTSGTNPTVSTEGGAAWESDEEGIRVFDGVANRLIGTVITESYTILQPDDVQAETDDLILYHFDARWYPFGVKMLGYTISTSASSSDTYLLEEWDDEAGSTQATSESIALSTATRAEDDGTLSDGDFAADSYLNLNLDDAQDDISQAVVTFAFYVKTGD